MILIENFVIAIIFLALIFFVRKLMYHLRRNPVKDLDEDAEAGYWAWLLFVVGVYLLFGDKL